MTKIDKNGSELAKNFLSGISKVSNCVGSTLGPNGKTVVITEGNTTFATKDGVTVAKHFTTKDPFENSAITLIKQASERTNSTVGDGTTSSMVLAEAIYKNGLKYIEMNSNPVLIKRGLEKAAKKVVEYIKSRSKPISTKEEIKEVALVSANNDEEIANVIAEVLYKIGDSTIKIENGGTEMSYKIVEGLSWTKGYYSPAFATNEKMECNLENPYVLITDSKLTSINQLIKPLQSVIAKQRPLLIICSELEGDCLTTLILNRLQKGLPICAVEAPSYGDNRKGVLADIAALTGGKVCSDETGYAVDEATVDGGFFGIAKSVMITKDSTTIIGSDAQKAALTDYVDGLKKQLENTKDEFHQKKLTERISKLTNGIGKIYVYGQTDAELRERGDRVVDAFYSARASLKGGVVPGGSLILLKSSKILGQYILDNEDSMTEDELLGMNILKKSLQAPARKIFDNAGIDSSLIVANIMNDDLDSDTGYDVLHNKYVNMIESGVVDPTLVEVAVVENATSIAGLLLTTDSAIVDDPDEKKEQQMPMPTMGL